MTFADMTSWSDFFDIPVFLLSSSVTGLSLISMSLTGSRVMKIFFYKGLIENPEIGNTLAWVLPNIWILGPIRDTKFDMNVFNEMLRNAVKCQSCRFYRFWVIKGKPTRGGCKITPLPLPTDTHTHTHPD